MPILTEKEGKRLSELLNKRVSTTDGFRLFLKNGEMQDFKSLVKKALDGIKAQLPIENGSPNKH